MGKGRLGSCGIGDFRVTVMMHDGTVIPVLRAKMRQTRVQSSADLLL